MLNIGRKIMRNLPEQVGFLTGEVEKIWEALDGLDVYDNVIILENLNPLTPSQLEIVDKPVAFIVYNNTLYMKRGVGVDEVYFDAVFQVSETGGIISFDSSEITVTYPLGTLSLSNTSASAYSKDESDILLSNKADLSAVLDLIFPEHSIFMSTNNTSPAGLIGGTWTPLNSGNPIVLPDAIRLPVNTRAEEHALNGANLWWKYSDGTQITPTNYYFHLVGGNNGTGKVGGSAGIEGNIVPINLWAENNGISVYMWERVS